MKISIKTILKTYARTFLVPHAIAVQWRTWRLNASTQQKTVSPLSILLRGLCTLYTVCILGASTKSARLYRGLRSCIFATTTVVATLAVALTVVVTLLVNDMEVSI